MAHFFATLFVRNPELRPMFPLTLGESRKWVFDSLTRCAWSFDQPESLTRWLGELGRDHRKFGVTEHHYRLFCDALLTTLQAFCAGSWSDQTQAAWERALATITAAMTAGCAAGQPGDGRRGRPGHRTGTASDAAAGKPAWWLAEVVEHDRRRPDLAVLALRPDLPLPYLAGQHVSVQVPRWPRVWREYSIANAPAPDGLLRLHVRAVPGGRVSTALVHQTQAGDTVVLGRARGEMTADAITLRPGGVHRRGHRARPGQGDRRGAHQPGPPAIPAGGAPVLRRADPGRPVRPARTAAARRSPPVADRHPGGRGGTRPRRADRPGGRGSRRPSAARAEDIVISGPAAMMARAAALVTAAAPAARLHADPLPGASRPL